MGSIDEQLDRRRFLQNAGSASLLLSLGSTWPLAADDDAATTIRLTPELLGHLDDLEPLIRRLIGAPQDRALEMLAAELHSGTTPAVCFAALFTAAARSNFHHPLFVVHSAHEIGLVLDPEDRLLPLFWSLSYFKDWQSRRRDRRTRRPDPTGSLPPGAESAQAFRQAMARMDQEASERAILALAATRGSRAAMDEMWHFGARDWTFVGHRAIAVTNARRTLDTLGWRYAGAALRFLNGFMYYWEAEDGQGQSYESNLARVASARGKLPPSWTSPTADEAATTELLRTIRTGDVDEACQLATRQLLGGHVTAGAVWDSVHVAAAELMMRSRDEVYLGGFPLHAVTAANALDTTFRSVDDDEARLLVTLQSVGWVTEFTRECIAKKGLTDLALDGLTPAPLPGTPQEAADDVLYTLEPGTGSKSGRRPLADPSSRDLAAAKVLAYGSKFPDSDVLMRSTLRHTLRKAVTDAHDLKYPVAVFENYHRVNPRWRPHVLAALVYRLYSSRIPDSAVYERMQDALAITSS